MSGALQQCGRRLELAKLSLLALLAVSLAAILIVAVYGLDIGQNLDDRARAFVRVLKLQTPTLVPSGRVSRNPGFGRAAVDLRPTPLLPIPSPDPETLLRAR